VGWARVGAFLLSAGLLLAWDVSEAESTALLSRGAVAAFVTFVVLVSLHRRIRRREDWYGLLEGLCQEGLHRLARDWTHLPPDPDGAAPPDHAYAGDLNAVGAASLMQLLGGVATRPGRTRLRGWLLDLNEAPPGPNELPARQAAVAELAPETEFRDRFTGLGRLLDDPGPDTMSRVTAWATAEAGPSVDTWQVWAARVLPPATLVLGWLEWTRPGPQRVWLVPLTLGVLLLLRLRGRTEALFQGAGVGDVALDALAPLALEAESMEPASSHLREVRGRFGTGHEAASQGLRRLRFWNAIAESRRNQFYLPFNMLLLLDIHVAWGLERWRRIHGARVPGWLDALAELDALAALGGLAHDHPGWAFPEFVDVPEDGMSPGVRMRAKELGHPLLAEAGCVCNDVEVGPPGTFLLVTGSNMSGKSTLLRALGLNALLAGVGAPVCATRLQVPVVRLATCMRVEDNLAQGVSLFRAELERLKGVVDAAGLPATRPLLYLLDEILLGTNTAERQIAARRVLARLAAAPVLGAVSTHDLDLADTPELRDAGRAVHFRETVVPGEGDALSLTFDYLLRDGPATSTNALALLKIVGLDVESDRLSGGV